MTDEYMERPARSKRDVIIFGLLTIILPIISAYLFFTNYPCGDGLVMAITFVPTMMTSLVPMAIACVVEEWKGEPIKINVSESRRAWKKIEEYDGP